MSNTAATAADQGLNPIRKRGKQVVAAGVGNVVEWYDWYTYSFLAVYFSKVVFPSGDATVALISAFGVFAASFLLRPIGGLFIGNIADKIGRRNTLVATIAAMGLGSLIVGITPTFAAAGIFSPIILVLGRVISGLSVGGEFAANTVFLVESAPANRRGLYSSYQYVSTTIGQLLASGLTALLVLLLDKQQMLQWGWRIPFFVGAVLSLVGLWIRRGTEETLEITAKADRPRFFDAVIKYPKATFLIIGITLAGTVMYYTWTTYLSTLIGTKNPIGQEDALLISTTGLFFFLLIQPLMGALSDKIGRRPLLIAAALAFGVCIIPAIYAVTHWGFVGTLIVVLVGMVFVSGFTSISAAVNAEVIPTHVRSAGIGFPYSVAVALFGGTAPLIATAFPNLFGGWVVILCVASLLVYVFALKETAFKPLPE